MTEKTDYVRIFDTTLRDGEQSPGASLTSGEKIEIARQLARLKVDIIEAGFPAASPDDLEAVRQIAREVGSSDGPIVAGLARANRSDIDTAWEAVKAAAKPRIHTFLATSDLHMEHKLGMTREQVASQIREMVSYAREYCDDVEFSPEDASRSDIDFLIEVLTIAIEAGATTLNIPDTVGYAVPGEWGALFARLISDTPGGSDVIWSAHGHDDLGLATANALAAVQAGARQVEVTINGIGERAGNTSLEEVVMALHTRHADYGVGTRVETRQLYPTSTMVSRFTGIAVPPNKAIVGDNAFAHEAGIHQHGMLKHKKTYEIMTPATVGVKRSQMVLGKHSGRHAFQARLEELGIHLDETELGEAFQLFKQLADRKKGLTDADLMAVVTEEISAPHEYFGLIDLQVACGRPKLSTATIHLRAPNGEDKVAASVGSGPVDAVFQAIRKVFPMPGRLVDYSVHSVTAGIDALGEASVRISPMGNDDRVFGGYGADTDIIVASAKAYLAALNRMYAQLGPAEQSSSSETELAQPAIDDNQEQTATAS
jgi:2-isopropylmalate synthase